MDDSDEVYVAIVERDFKRQARQLNDHFKKLLEATHLNHSYPVKHYLKDCTMMKNLMTLGALSGGKKHEGDPSVMVATPAPRETTVMAISG
jgi:hypothetical protein